MSSNSTCPDLDSSQARAIADAKPVVIAHRGASGYLPEHTLAAKALAYGLGADYLEQDVVGTRDGELVVLHDSVLDDVSNVAEMFPERSRSDGHYYVIDFDLAELRRLELRERRAPGSTELRFPGRFSGALPGFRVVTLDEELELVAGLNATTGRSVGVYPEVKHPAWHRAHGMDLAGRILEMLAAHGYRDREARAFVQCFDAKEVERMRSELATPLRLVQLLEADQLANPAMRGARLERIAACADGIGMPYEDLLDSSTDAPAPSSLPAEIREAGLELHPYTFRRDWPPGQEARFEALLEIFMADIGVEGLFCDHPDIAVRVRDRLRSGRRAGLEAGFDQA